MNAPFSCSPVGFIDFYPLTSLLVYFIFQLDGCSTIYCIDFWEVSQLQLKRGCLLIFDPLEI